MSYRRCGAAVCAIGFSVAGVAHAQDRGQAAEGKPKVDMVQAVGCVERKSDTPPTWWLNHATTPQTTTTAYFNAAEIEQARAVRQGTQTFQLIGVADFRDRDGLLQEGDRAKFTTRETANASGQLGEGRKVVVKGLLIEAGDRRRINLMTVLSLADTCGAH